MFLIVGLGNPGKQYVGSRHNIGFQVIELLSRQLKANKPLHSSRAIYAFAEYRNRKVVLAQPLTFMNRSGMAVKELLQGNSILFSDMLVIYDDLDLPPGYIRLRRSGSSAGHRGIQSIIDALGTSDFPRLRIGIGKPSSVVDAGDYVLQKPGFTECEMIESALIRAAEAVKAVLEEGMEEAMNHFNQNLLYPD